MLEIINHPFTCSCIVSFALSLLSSSISNGATATKRDARSAKYASHEQTNAVKALRNWTNGGNFFLFTACGCRLGAFFIVGRHRRFLLASLMHHPSRLLTDRTCITCMHIL
jgi:hypothetical protein